MIYFWLISLILILGIFAVDTYISKCNNSFSKWWKKHIAEELDQNDPRF